MVSKKHIMFCANSAWNIVNFRLPLMRYLADLGYRVSAAAPPNGYEEACREVGFDFFPFQMSRKGTNPLTDLRTCFSLKKIFRRERPDLVCNFTVKPDIYGTIAAAACRIPAVNNISGLGTVFITHSFVTGLVKKLYRYSQKRAAKVFFQNVDDLSQFLEHGLVPEEKTGILPGSGIDLERFAPADPDGYSGSNVQSTCTFLLIGRMLGDKGVREYVEAARIITAERRDGQFMLLGPLDHHNRTAIGPNELEEWSISGVVRYLGAAEDVRSHIAAADCVVLPSYREGTPRTLLEAAAMGKPIVATDVPGCRQVVDEAVTGYLCRPYSADSLAGAIRKILNLRPRERYDMGMRGRKKMEREYDQRLVFEAYGNVIGEILGIGCSGAIEAGDTAAREAAGPPEAGEAGEAGDTAAFEAAGPPEAPETRAPEGTRKNGASGTAELPEDSKTPEAGDQAARDAKGHADGTAAVELPEDSKPLEAGE